MDDSWNFMDPASKDRLLGVLRREMDEMLVMVSDPTRWEAPTCCGGWGVRDVVGHLVDTTEGYLPAFEIARTGGEAPAPHGLRVMASVVDEGARSFRTLSQDEMLSRLRTDIDRMMAEFDRLTPEEWGGLQVPHPFMGPLPAMFYPTFQLVDYAVHGWDVQESSGRPHALDGDAADLLVPVIFVLWQATADLPPDLQPYTIGLRTFGHNGGDTRVDVSPDGMRYEPGDIGDCPAILEFDPATLVLAGYGRTRGGTVRGDRALASRFLGQFFAI